MDAKEQRDRIWKLEDVAIPPWVRTFILALLLTMLGGLGGVYVHAQSTYAEKEALKEFKNDTKSRLDRMDDKLDMILEIVSKARS